MDIFDDAAYRHERLPVGAFQEPETMHLHVDLGGNVDVLRDLRNQLLLFGATPKVGFIVEQFINPTFPFEEFETDFPRDLSAGQFSAILSLPVTLDEELISHLRLILRHLHDGDVHPFRTELERVVAHVDTKGVTRIADVDSLWDWETIDADFEASYPDLIELHHSVKIPKQSSKPPISLAELAARSKDLGFATWSIFRNPDTWSYRSTVPVQADPYEFMHSGELAAILQRDYAILPSIFKDVSSKARYSIVAEEVIGEWTYPLDESMRNPHKGSFIAVTGVSHRDLPNFDEVLAQCKQAPGKKLLIRDKQGKARIAANLEAFQRIAEAQGFEPILIDLGLNPVAAGDEYFGSQVVTHAGSESDAEAILEAWRNAAWSILQSGYSPMMSHPETYKNLFFWAKGPTLDSPKTNGGTSKRVSAMSEQLFSLTPVRQYRPIEDTVIRLFHTTIVTSPESFHTINAGLLAVPFEGERCRGCLFALVSAEHLDERRIRDLATFLSIMLHKTALKKAPAPTPAATPAQNNARVRYDIRIQQVRDHDKLWAAIEGLASEPGGRRMERMAIAYPEAYALFDQYPQLKNIFADIERSGKITEVVLLAWKTMTGTEPRRLFEWRKIARTPSRKRI